MCFIRSWKGGNIIRYFGGKSKIAKDISKYINTIFAEGENNCNILEENKKSQNQFPNSLTLHTHTHTLRRTILWLM
jgi:hypothetical protein